MPAPGVGVPHHAKSAADVASARGEVQARRGGQVGGL